VPLKKNKVELSETKRLKRKYGFKKRKPWKAKKK
jgi:hypothetical protein